MEDVQMEDLQMLPVESPNQPPINSTDEHLDLAAHSNSANEQTYSRNREIFELLYKRDGPGSDKTVPNENTFDINESNPIHGKPIHLKDVIDIGPIEETKFLFVSQQLSAEDHEFYSDVPPIWLNPHLTGRQTFMSKYIRAVNKCYREGLYDYDDPNFDPMFPDADRHLISLEDAVHREKENKMRNGIVKKETEKVDRERMPPPSMPVMNSETAKSEPIQASMKDDYSSEKKFPCSVEDCKKAYKNLQGLKNHMKNCHPGIAVASRLSTTEESILASTLHNNGQKLGSTTPQPRSQTPQSAEIPQNYPVPTPPMTPQQPSSLPQTPVRYESLTPQQQQQQMVPQQQVIQVQPQNQNYQTHGQPQLQYVAVSMPMNVSSGTMYAQPITIQQQNQQRIQVQQSYQQQQSQPSSQSIEHYQQIDSSQASSSMEFGDESNANYSGASRPPNTGIKLKCPNCSKSYKTQQNLQKHLKENHQQNANEIDVTLTKRSNYYPQNSSQNRQEMVVMEQDANISGHPSPVVSCCSTPTLSNQELQTYVRQISQTSNQHVQIIEQTNDQQQQSQQYGQQIVHYQVQQMPQQQTRQIMPMEIDNQQQTNYVTTNDASEVMVVDQNSSQKMNEQPQQMIIQTSSGPVVKQIGQTGQQPLIRQVSANPRQQQPQQQQMHLISSPVHIIQQQGQQMVTQNGERVTFVVRQQQSMRPMATQQIRSGQQIVNAPPGTTYVYQQTTGTPSGPVTKYYLNTTPTRPNQGQEMDGNDYYSSPPQLTPQQTVPQRVRPQQTTSYQNYRPRPGQSVRITQTPMTGAKNTSVRYTVQVPQGQAQTAFMTTGTPSGSVQYIRSPAQIAQNGVKFITTSGQNVLRVPSQGVRPGQQMQSIQQYPVTIQGSPISIPRQPGYQQRPQRVRLTVPNQGSQPRRLRPQNPTNVVQINQQPLRPLNSENSGQIQESNVQNEQQ